MKLRQERMLAAVGAASPFEQVRTRLLLPLSAPSRRQHAEYKRVGNLLAAALGAEDDTITIRVHRSFGEGRRNTLVVLALLALIVGSIVVGWVSYAAANPTGSSGGSGGGSAECRLDARAGSTRVA